MGMAQCSLCLDFAPLMASLGFCSLSKAVLRGFQAWGCLAVRTLSSSRLEGGGHAGGSGRAWPWLWSVAVGCLCIPVGGKEGGQAAERLSPGKRRAYAQGHSDSASKGASTIWCLCTPVKVEGGGSQGLWSAVDIPLPSFVLQEICAYSLPSAAPGSIATRCGSHAFLISPAALGAASAACRAGNTHTGILRLLGQGSELVCAP